MLFRTALPVLFAAAACAPPHTTAPAPAAPAARGAAAITAADVARHIGIIGDDSMLGRATPSPELDKVASYIASEFRRFGLKPGGDSGTYLQRYPLDVYRFLPESSAVVATGRAPARWQIGRDMILAEGDTPRGELAGAVTVVAGDPQQGGTLDSAAVTGHIVILALGPTTNAVAGKLLPLRPTAAILLLADSLWTKAPGRDATTRVKNPGKQTGLVIPPVLYVQDSAFAPWLTAAGSSLEAARAAGPFVTQILPQASLQLNFVQYLVERTTAPNVIGILEGSDPTLKQEYVLFSAHMDHIGRPADGQGCAPKGADSICNGADDDGSGTVAVLELAKAFATSAERPKRSLVFMTVSGEERGLWGSAYFADHPTVPLASIVADLNSDMVGRNWKDTIAVIGREHSNLGTTLDSVAARHPELHLKPVGDLWPQEGLFFRSDHFNFARKGVPILFFTSGLHPDYHEVSDSPDKIDAEKMARYAQLAYYLALEVANAAQQPQWNPDSYKRIVQGAN